MSSFTELMFRADMDEKNITVKSYPHLFVGTLQTANQVKINADHMVSLYSIYVIQYYY